MTALPRTRSLWNIQRELVGDRLPLFQAIADACPATSVLYPGSYVDITPSVVWPSVVYVDVDRRARRFFDDDAGVRALVAEQGAEPGEIAFIAADYTEPLDVEERSFDLLISLYAGFVSEHCSRYLRPGGLLLANSSHGDVAMASLQPHFALCGAVEFRNGRARVRTEDLDTYLVPKRNVAVTVAGLHESGRGIAFTRSAFAYLFRFEPGQSK